MLVPMRKETRYPLGAGQWASTFTATNPMSIPVTPTAAARNPSNRPRRFRGVLSVITS